MVLYCAATGVQGKVHKTSVPTFQLPTNLQKFKAKKERLKKNHFVKMLLSCQQGAHVYPPLSHCSLHSFVSQPPPTYPAPEQHPVQTRPDI
jgi:hypothetical protein